MAHFAADSGDNTAPNHPNAVWMAVIAGFCFNIVIGTVMGSFSGMLPHVMHDRNVPLSSAGLGMILVMIGSALVGPFVGVLMARFSLRWLMLLGAVLTTGGFLALAYSNSYAVYLLVFGLCFGPAMTLTGSVGPNTLVTRWFSSNRGLAVGLVNLAILIAILPERQSVILDQIGPQNMYLVLAGISAIMLPLCLFIQDYPPNYVAPAVTDLTRTADGSLTMGQLAAKAAFWAMCLAAAASMTSSILLGSLMHPIGQTWHYTGYQSAVLQSIMSTIGIAGGILFGFIADKIGGSKTLALVGFDCAILWFLLMQHLPFWPTAVVIGLIGLHGAAAMPAMARALSDAFGAASYSRGIGLNTLISLPFSLTALMGSSKVIEKTGSFVLIMQIMVALFLIGGCLALFAASRTKKA